LLKEETEKGRRRGKAIKEEIPTVLRHIQRIFLQSVEVREKIPLAVFLWFMFEKEKKKKEEEKFKKNKKKKKK